MLPLDKITLQCHTYHLEQEDVQTESLNCDAEGSNEAVSAANYWLLPHVSFDGIWENLVYDNYIKEEVIVIALLDIIGQCFEIVSQ